MTTAGVYSSEEKAPPDAERWAETGRGRGPGEGRYTIGGLVTSRRSGRRSGVSATIMKDRPAVKLEGQVSVDAVRRPQIPSKTPSA